MIIKSYNKTDLKEVKEFIINKARKQHGEIFYCGKAESREECFTFELGEIQFWFNTLDNNTHAIIEDFL